MSDSFDVVWLSASPSLKCFDQRLLRYLSRNLRIAEWEYFQTLDEASCVDEAVALLSDFLKSSDRPVHLIGHGMGGVVALTYARQYPECVRSLTLLAVASQPANTWHAHYYVQRQLFPISCEEVLANSVRSLFGSQRPYSLNKLITLLNRDLEETPTLHSLLRLVNLPKGGVSMPLMVCGSKTDPIVNPPALQDWLNWFKPEDTLWECSTGSHFFHYFHPQEVGEQILKFWQSHQQKFLKMSSFSLNTVSN